MVGKCRSALVFAVVVGLVGSVSAAEYYWDNLAPDSNSFCVAENWNPDGNPGIFDYVLIRPGSIGRVGPTVDCYVDVWEMEGPGGGQPMFVGAGGNFNIGNFWNWDDVGVHGIGDPTTVNVSGNGIVNIGGNWEIGERTGTPFTLNVIDNPEILVAAHMLTTYDDPATRFYLNMSGGSLEVEGRLSWGWADYDTFGVSENKDFRPGGGGEMNISGGATVTCNTLVFTSGGRRNWTLNLDGGTIFVEDTFSAPVNDPNDALADSNAFMYLDSGTLECGAFDHNDHPYAMDINEGLFIIHGDHEADMLADVGAGYITAFNGTEDVIVEVVDGNTIVRADVVKVKASDPSPEDFSLSECPGVGLSWTAGAEAKATQGHDVYFGTDINDVTNAATSAGLGVYMGRQDSSAYPESGTLAVSLGVTYYWRIDEIGDSNLWTGDVWQFTVSDGTASEPYPSDLAITVDPFVELQWSGGCETDSHNVYLGTDFDDVDNATTADLDLFKGNQPGTTYTPDSALDYFTYYYWRVDEIEDGNTYKGRVWQFRTGSYIPDERMVLLYELDETGGGFVHDSSGYEHHGNTYGIGNNWEPNNGHIEGCLDFQGDGHILVPSSTLDSITDEITVAVWLNGYDEDDDMVVFDTGDDDNRMRGTAPTEGPGLDVYWRAGNDSNDVLLWEDATPEMWLDEWHHYAFTKDETSGTMKIFFDGIAVKSRTGTTSSLANVKDSIFKIGAKNTASSDFDGKMDDFRIYDQALSDIEISGLFRGADIALAWGAQPFNGQSNVILDPVLRWRNGQFAASHNVYFGTDFDDVNDADTTTVSVYKGNQEANEYDPGTLDFDTTYYWRIDEVNNADVNSPWKGRTWEFTVANYIVIDDMESYDPFINRIWYAWDNPWGSGSFVELGVAPFVPVHSGDNSLEFLYDNTLKWDFFSYWSETEYSLDSAQDWTQADVQVLTVFFHGDPNNDANATEQMYVGIEDSGAGRTDIYYPDMNDIVVTEWHEWNLEISDFAGVDATDVTKVYLGFGSSDNTDTPGGEGIVYFDNIRLYPPKCVPSLGPALDFSGDCIVGFDEVAMMSEDWLLSDLLLVGIGTPDPCVLHYKFDESSGTTVADSSGNGYTGTAFDDLNQTPTEISGRMDPGISGNSLHISDEFGISIPPEVFTDNGISQEITVALWIINAHPDEDPDGGAFMLEFREWDEVSPDANERVLAVETTDDGDTYVFHDNGQDVSYDLDWASHTEWTHYCFIRDANNLTIYVNGILEEASASSGSPLADPNLLYLGISADRAPGNTEGTHDGFTGNVEDFQIFDYAITEGQAGYLGTGGTGYVPMPPSIMDLYDGEPAGLKAVNLRDFAVLMNSWLEIQLWPE